jgi:RNA recognition motif-containing protein
VNPKKLYVGNLPFSTTEDTLKEYFGEVGNVVTVQLIIDKFSGKSKGFGFVEFSSAAEAQAAIDRFHGTGELGRPLTVNHARPLERRDGGRGR